MAAPAPNQAKRKLDEYDKYVESHRPNDTITVRQRKLSCAALCSKRALLVMNLIILIFGIILIAVGAYVLNSSVAFLTTRGLPAGMIVLGTFLLILSVVGCIGSIKESKKILGWYGILLALIILVQAILAIVLLTNSGKAESYVVDSWSTATKDDIIDIQNTFDCCCLEVTGDNKDAPCPDPAKPTCPEYGAYCLPKLKDKIQDNLAALGAVGITFALIQILAVCMALCMRCTVNQDKYQTQRDDRT